MWSSFSVVIQKLMDNHLWSFICNAPNVLIPFPWERCYNVRRGMLYYKNRRDGTIVVDLRTRVSLGNGLYNMSNVWFGLTGRSPENNPVFGDDEREQDPPFLLYTVCCRRPPLFLVVPELVRRCPICGCALQLYHT